MKDHWANKILPEVDIACPGYISSVEKFEVISTSKCKKWLYLFR